MTTLKQLPALVVLERIPVPVLAIGHDGSILFTNNAFGEMVGRGPVHALVDTVVELAHKDGSVVRALMSKSALMRADDQFALAAFQDLTEQLWEAGR
jgi:PAS domain-containing protein